MPMSRPRALVLRTSGTNCEVETARALDLGGAETEIRHFHRTMEDPSSLEAFQLLVLAGGFSYGDDIAAGRVWGLELDHSLRDALRGFVERGGLVLGVCNGFQVLVDSGIFEPGAGPGADPASGSARAARSIALTGNASNHYECRWVELETEDCACPWLVTGERFPVPVAHAEGRFVVRDSATLERLREGRQLALRYVIPAGAPSSYPHNPNGSVADVAGICDTTGRVLGLMPHPERNLTPWNHPHWTRLAKRDEGEGLSFYRRMVEVAAAAPVQTGSTP